MEVVKGLCAVDEQGEVVLTREQWLLVGMLAPAMEVAPAVGMLAPKVLWYSISCPMKLRLGEMIGLLLFTNL